MATAWEGAVGGVGSGISGVVLWSGVGPGQQVVEAGLPARVGECGLEADMGALGALGGCADDQPIAGQMAADGGRREALLVAMSQVPGDSVGARIRIGGPSAARRWGEPGTLGEALRARAMFVTGSQRIGLLQEAATILDGSKRVLDLVGALVDLGAALRRAGSPHEAQEPLRRGLAIADQSGAVVLARRAREELGAAGGRPRRSALQGRDALTPSELRVATLASEGRSNPDIAGLLFVTRRTVETHLTQSYAKLGVRSRSDLSQALQGPADR